VPESRVNRREREALRQAIEVKEQLRQIARVIQSLESGTERVRVDGVEVDCAMDKSRVAALGVALNGRFRLLAKVMPDLKAVELDLGEDTMGAMREFNSIERAARVAFLLERLREKRTGPDTVGGDPDLDAAAGPTKRRPSFLS